MHEELRSKDAHPGQSCYSAVRWAMRHGALDILGLRTEESFYIPHGIAPILKTEEFENIRIGTLA